MSELRRRFQRRDYRAWFLIGWVGGAVTTAGLFVLLGMANDFAASWWLP